MSLAKVFEDDPGMRPKVFAPPSVNKVSYGLMSQDIAGAVPQVKAAPNKARDTNPNAPNYVLPGSSTQVAEVAAAVAAVAAPAPAAAAPAAGVASEAAAGQPQTKRSRDTLRVSDINAVTSRVERAHKMETRSTQLQTSDIEGSCPGWEPHYRAHVGRNLRDPGLDVRDISGTGTSQRRRALSARPTVGSRAGYREPTTTTAAASTPPVPVLVPVPEQQEFHEQPDYIEDPDQGEFFDQQQQHYQQQYHHQHHHQHRQHRQQQQPQSYLPPPMSWQQQVVTHPPASGEETPPPPPQQQQQHHQPPHQQPPHQQPAHAAGSWPTTVTLPLRPTLAPPPYATLIPTGSVAATLGSSLEAAAAARTSAVADHPSTTVGRATPGRRDARLRHSAKCAVADVQRADAAEAQRVIWSLCPSKEAVEEFWSSCRRLDREVCGKLLPADFKHALHRANLLAAGAQGAAAVEPEVAATALARGLQDGSGMVSYRYLAKALLGQTLSRRGSLAASSAAAAAVEARSAALSSSSAAAAAAASGAAALRSSPRPMSRQPSGGRSNVVAAGGGGGSGGGHSGGVATTSGGSGDGGVGDSGGPQAVGHTGSLRRSVMWAPEPVVELGGPAAGASSEGQAAPLAAQQEQQHHNRHQHQHHQHRHQQPQHQQQPQLQHQQQLKDDQRRSVPSGTITAVFQLGATQQGPLRPSQPPRTSRPASAHPPAHYPAPATADAVPTPAPAAAYPAEPSAKYPNLPNLGVGPNWPPELARENLQKRDAEAIMETAGVQLRDVCDTTFFPFKAHPYWFGGRAPVVAGTEAPGGPSEAAREYQPSVDPTSFIVGKGHHRINIAGTGQKLDPEVEAAIVQRLRPHSAFVTPESTVRASRAASVISQLHVDNPLLYPGAVDPTTPAGNALRGLLGALYSSGGSSSNSGNNRPATAGQRRTMHSRPDSVTRSMSALAGGGGGIVRAAAGGGRAAAAGGGGAAAGGGGGQVRVGRVALERQMHREAIAAVRNLG